MLFVWHKSENFRAGAGGSVVSAAGGGISEQKRVSVVGELRTKVSKATVQHEVQANEVCAILKIILRLVGKWLLLCNCYCIV